MTTWFRRTPEAEALVAEERLVLAATEMIHEALEATGTTKRKLAEKLGVRPTEISQRLSGRRNLTLRSLARMMHELGYGIALEPTEPFDLDAVEAGMGRRVRKELVPATGQRAHVWDIGVHVMISEGTAAQRTQLHIDSVLKDLRALDSIRDVSAEYPGESGVLVKIAVEANDVLSAIVTGLNALRTAIHTVGGRTPGWEKGLHRIVRDMEIRIDSVEDRSDEPTACQ